MPIEHLSLHVRLGEQEADVDRELAFLILEIWRSEIRTLSPCDGNLPEGWCGIWFASAPDATQFLTVVGQYERERRSLFQRLIGTHSDPDNWRYLVLPVDLAPGVAEAHLENSRPVLDLAVRVEFPKSDLESLIGRMREFNSAGRCLDPPCAAADRMKFEEPRVRP